MSEFYALHVCFTFKVSEFLEVILLKTQTFSELVWIMALQAYDIDHDTNEF